MQKPITTRTHGQLDFITAGTLLLLPHLFGKSRSLRGLLKAAGAAKLTYALLSRHELALAPLIPMETHLQLDCIAGATVAAAPFLLGESSATATALCAALGAFDIAVAPLTQLHMKSRSPQPEQPRQQQQPHPTPAWQMPRGRAPQPRQQAPQQQQQQSRPEAQPQPQPAPHAAAAQPAPRPNPPEPAAPQHHQPEKGGLDHVEGAGKGPMEGVVWPARTR